MGGHEGLVAILGMLVVGCPSNFLEEGFPVMEGLRGPV
jgi:hypothetical protein